MKETINVGDLLAVDPAGVIQQMNQTIVNLVRDNAVRSQQVSQLTEHYSKIATELDELKKYIETTHPNEFKKLYESEVETDGNDSNNS